MTNLQRDQNASAIVKTLVRSPPVAGCFIFIRRKTCVLIPERCVVQRNGIPPTKDSFCVAGRKNQNEKTLHADLLPAGITQLITVLVADKIHKHQYIRSLKPLIA